MLDYVSRFVTLNGTKMNYLEAGSGKLVLFIHRMPISSYLRRHILPALSDTAHCLALNLMRIGKSDKPDIDYTVFEHIHYVNQFIETLNLKDITLVVHGWDSVIRFDSARRNNANVKALAFFESHIHQATD